MAANKKPRKKYRPLTANSDLQAVKLKYASFLLLDKCRPYESSEVAHDAVKVWAAFERLQDGTADQDDFNRVAVAINMAHVRALDIDDGLAQEVAKAKPAMMRCKARYTEKGVFGFSRTDTEVMRTALEIEHAIAEKSSPKQMEDAMNAMHKILLRQQSQNANLPIFTEVFTKEQPCNTQSA